MVVSWTRLSLDSEAVTFHSSRHVVIKISMSQKENFGLVYVRPHHHILQIGCFFCLVRVGRTTFALWEDTCPGQ